MEEFFVRPDVRQFLDYLNALPGPRAHELPPVEARQMMAAGREVLDVPMGELAVLRDLAFAGPDGPIRLRLFDARETRGPGPLVVYFHGGGFVLGDLDSHQSVCAEIARTLDLPVLAVDYRLAPEHPFPAGVEDSIAAARWAAGDPETLGRDVTGLVLVGDSAGGNFAIVVAMALRDTPAAVPVLAQWAIYPVAEPNKVCASDKDFADGFLLTRAGMDWFEACYCGDRADWRYNPMLASQAGMPPTLVTTASLDPLRDQGRAYAAVCVEAGVPTIFHEAVGNIHGFVTLRRAVPSSVADVAEGLAALKLLLARAGA